jgi:hypothetical protein
MNAQLQLAQGIVAGRAWSDQDFALLREAELAAQDRRRARRGRRARTR